MSFKNSLRALLVFSCAVFSPVLAQFSASSLSEFQVGNLPDSEPDDLSNLYGNLFLTYDINQTSLGLRLESFQSSVKERSYEHIQQRFFAWRSEHLNIRLGNFYTTLGRGLLLRAFELPNVVFEQRSYRRRYIYYRDMDGVLVNGAWSKFEFIFLRGTPLKNEFPPKVENLDRREGAIDGGQFSVRPATWLMLGTAYAKTHFDLFSDYEMNSLFFQLNLNEWLRRKGLKKSSLKIYGEHARSYSTFDDFFSTAKDDPHATYFSLNFSYQKLGFTAEYKDYRAFENRISLPPILFKEHSYYLLNRITHEILADGEKGYQFEATFRLQPKLFLLGNVSYAKNEIGIILTEFAERFFETTVYWSPNMSSKTFYDWSKDEIKGEISRKTGGIDFEWQFYRDYGCTVEMQHQEIKRKLGPTLQENLSNTYSSLTFSRAPSASVSLVLDRSTDPSETDKATTPFFIERDAKYWLSATASYQVNIFHELSLFYGARRGGLVCLSGTCFEVLPFEGFELRWIGHF